MQCIWMMGGEERGCNAMQREGERGKGGKGEDLLKDSWHDFGILKKKKYRTDTYLDQYSLRILEILWKLLATTGSGFIKFVYA